MELSRPVCGQKELQLTFIQSNSSLSYRKAESLNGCEVRVIGNIDNSPTAHYSTEMFIEDGNIKPNASCNPSPMRPDPSQAPIPYDLKSYKATATLNFAEGSKPMQGEAHRTDDKTDVLTPWQAYIEPMLNGGEDLLWVTCRDGFHLKDATTSAIGSTGKPGDWLNKQTPGLVAPEKPGTSSITITCTKTQSPS